MKIPCFLALAAVASTARGMTDDNDEPQQRRLNQLGASFGDAADFASTLGQGGSASVAVGMPQGDENADQNPRILSQVGQWFGDAATSLGDISLRSLLPSQNEASDEPDTKRLCVRPGADGECEAEDDVEEEVDGRQKVRMKETGRIGHVVELLESGWLRVELDGPELELIKTRNTLVTFLDEDDKEMAWKDVRRPYDPKFIKGGPRARTKFEEKLDAWGAVHLVDGEKTPIPSFKGEFDWCKIDTANYKDIPVEQAPEMDVSMEVFQGCGRGNTKERQKLREYLMDLRARRERDHKETLKPKHHLEKGIDDLYDAETNSHRYTCRQWRDGSGRQSVWKAVSKKIKEVDALRCPHTNTLSSADVDRPDCPTDFFHDQEFQEKLWRRSIEGLTGEETVYPPGSMVYPDEEGFEGIRGYVHRSDGRLYYSWGFHVRNQGGQYSPVFYDTKEEARKAREAAMDAFDWPPFLTDGFTTDPRKRTPRSFVKDPAFYFAIKQGGVPDPWDIGFGNDYKEYDNPLHRYHGTSLQNLLANLDSIKDEGLLLRALCDDPSTNKPHSRCGEKLWACATMRNCFAHMRGDMTISRHVKNELNTYDKWFQIAILALPAAGWEKKFTPDYRYSGFYSEGPVVPVACLRVNLLEGLAGLKKAQKWARDGHPRDHPDSCW